MASGEATLKNDEPGRSHEGETSSVHWSSERAVWVAVKNDEPGWSHEGETSSVHWSSERSGLGRGEERRAGLVPRGTEVIAALVRGSAIRVVASRSEMRQKPWRWR